MCVCVLEGKRNEGREGGKKEGRRKKEIKRDRHYLNLNTLIISFLPYHAHTEQRSLLFIQKQTSRGKKITLPLKKAGQDILADKTGRNVSQKNIFFSKNEHLNPEQKEQQL